MDLFHASHQWATRPNDQRFNSLNELYQITRAYADQAAEANVEWPDMRVEAIDDDLRLVGKSGVPAKLTHHAFGQLAARMGAGRATGYLRGLPATLAAQNMNHGLKTKTDGRANLLFHRNNDLVLRAATTETYVRLWNYEIAERLIEAASTHNLVPARQTFTWDGTPLPPESERPAALYASDHDLWAFVMSTDRVVMDPQRNPLFRGIIISNSEVGDCAIHVKRFFFRDLCCNHIIWGAEELVELSLAHVGQIRDRWQGAIKKVRDYLDASAAKDEEGLRKATVIIPGASKEEILDFIFGKRLTGATKSMLRSGYDAVVEEQDGPANTLWGLAQGLTRFSQTIPFADERQQIDRVAGKVLQIAF